MKAQRMAINPVARAEISTIMLRFGLDFCSGTMALSSTWMTELSFASSILAIFELFGEQFEDGFGVFEVTGFTNVFEACFGDFGGFSGAGVDF